jgi:malate dehydrogenase
MPVCAWTEGQYGIEGVYLGVLAKLDASGVGEIVEVDLTDSETTALREAAVAVKEKVEDLRQI